MARCYTRQDLIHGAYRAQSWDLVTKVHPTVPAGTECSVPDLTEMRVYDAAYCRCAYSLIYGGGEYRGKTSAGRPHQAKTRGINTLAGIKNPQSSHAFADHNAQGGKTDQERC